MSNSDNIANIEKAIIEWGSDESTIDKSQSFPLAYPYSAAPVVMVNRTQGGAKRILPVTATTETSYTIKRNSNVNGTQPFNWMSIGSNGTGDSDSSPVIKSGSQIALLQWGTGTSRTDSTEYFPFNETFENDCYAVIVQRMKSDTNSILPVVEIAPAGFKIDRNNDINGSQDFMWVAVGDCSTQDNNYFEIDLGNGYALKGGQSESTSDKDEVFSFSSMGLTAFGLECTSVVTNRCKGGAKNILAVTTLLADSFTINRNNDINGSQSFYWLALGKN